MSENSAGPFWVSRDQDLANVSLFELADGQSAAITRVGPEENRKNEDAATVVATGPRSALLAVADGFGGAPSGERASGLAISALAAAALASRSDDAPLRTAILDGFESANRGILELGIGAATTLAAVGIEDGVARPFHSGDSAILVIGGRGKIKCQTVAHSPAGYAVASGWVAERDARKHDEAQVVSNYLGSPAMRIEVGPELLLAPRDTVLIASDGLADNLSLQQVVEIVTRSPSLGNAVAELATRARERMQTESGKPDDLTIIAFRRQTSTAGERSGSAGR